MTTDHHAVANQAAHPSASEVFRGALRQAKVMLRIHLLTPASLISWLFFPVVGFVVLFLLRGKQVMDSDLSLAQIGVPGILTMYLISAGFFGISAALLTESEDGTLLRAKAVPHGMTSHLVGNVITHSVIALVPILLLLLAAIPFFSGVAPSTASQWLTFIWVSLLGLAAILPWGAVFGALAKGPASIAWASIIIYGSMSISGIFYPLAALPGWLQLIGKLLPTYWIGLGFRSALLPGEAVVLELGQTWATGVTALVLAAWAVVGMVIVPATLRRLARRQSGSRVAAARERVLSRGY